MDATAADSIAGKKKGGTPTSKGVLVTLSLILLSAPVMPGVPAALASRDRAEGTGAPFSAEFEGDRRSGTMGVTPIDGDCASGETTCRCAGWWLFWRCAVR